MARPSRSQLDSSNRGVPRWGPKDGIWTFKATPNQNPYAQASSSAVASTSGYEYTGNKWILSLFNQPSHLGGQKGTLSLDWLHWAWNSDWWRLWWPIAPAHLWAKDLPGGKWRGSWRRSDPEVLLTRQDTGPQTHAGQPPWLWLVIHYLPSDRKSMIPWNYL